MTFEQLQEVNKTLKTTEIHGKAYAEVNQRIKAFRMLYPDGTIETEILHLENDMCVIKATVGFYDTTVHGEEYFKTLATGIAYEVEGRSNINKTSYIENCETSAVGRALGMLGIGIDTSVASYEEVATAIEQQEVIKANEMTPAQMEIKIKTLVDLGKDEAKIREALEKEKDKGAALNKWLVMAKKETTK